MSGRLSTGNEFISIPDISKSTAGIQDFGFMYSSFRACIELHGSQDTPLLRPSLEMDGADLFQGEITSEMLSYWVPRFEVASPDVRASYIIFAPLDRRGFVCVLTVENTSQRELRLQPGFLGCWESTYHAANVSKLMAGVKHASMSAWRPGVPVVEYRGHTPLFAVAMVTETPVPVELRGGDASTATAWREAEITAQAGRPLYWKVADDWTLAPGERRSLPIYLGLGLEEISAISSAEELKLHGWERMLAGLTGWLDARAIGCEDEQLRRLVNVNSFYNYFYSLAIALDTEELVVTKARSARNNECASYGDREALIWSLPAVLLVDWSQARKVLLHSFTVQMSNVGVHSRYINGIVLEPGLQLDQLCAPIQALHSYVGVTGDMSILFDRRVQHGINTIQQILAAQRHPEVTLFETLLLPSGEPSRLPYVCYSNVMVWRALRDVAWMYDRIRDLDRAMEASTLADRIRAAVLAHFVVEGPFGRQFARAIDLEGNHELGDDPAGSLQMLSYHGFCALDDPVYRNTVHWVHSEHNPYSEECAEGGRLACAGRSVLGLINELLSGRREMALELLRDARLDDGIACETIDRVTGEAISGRAFASAAGYLAYGLRTALNMESPVRAAVPPQRRPSEVLYQPPPPEANQTPKKARL